MLNIFKKEDFNKVSDNYYNSYRADLKKKEVRNNFLSLNNIIKAEFFTLVAGLVFMSYNNFFDNLSIEIQDNFFMPKTELSKDAHLDKEERVVSTPFQNREILIKEVPIEDFSVEEQVAILSKKLNIDSTDMTLLVEIIKSQVNKSTSSVLEDKIIISQL